MRRFLSLAMIATALVVIPAGGASAATFTETQTDSIPATDTNWSTPPAPPDPLTFDQFDATKGTLTQVTIRFDSALTGSMAAENFSTSSTCDVTLDWGADVTLDTTDGVLTSDLGQTETPPTLSIFDGTLDFGGTSGVTIGNLSQTDSQQASITGAAMAPFIGVGTVTLDATATGTSTATGCGTVVSQLITQAGVEVEVVYTFEAAADIDMEKATNGDDADTPTGPAIPVGDPVNWAYVVTNTGVVPLSNIVVTDDLLGVIPGPDSGDDNNNSILETTETWTYSANGVAQLGQYANLGITTGVPPVGPPVADEDPSHYIGVPVGSVAADGHDVGLVDIDQGKWYLRDAATGAITSFFYGNPIDLPISGDWNGDGVSTPGLYRQSDGFFYARDTNTQGPADNSCFAGDPSDIPVVGDWDGDGDDNLGIYRPSEQKFYLFTITCTGLPMGAAPISFGFGNPGDKPVTGDWDGDGIDEIGLHRESTGFFYWRNTLDTGIASGQIFFGDPGDRFVSGDWGIVDGTDTPSIFRPSDLTFYFRHTLTQGAADSQFTWTGAGSGWLPVAGDFGLG